MNQYSQLAIVLVSLTFFHSAANAECDSFPSMPRILQAERLIIPQLEPMQEVYKQYINELGEYRSCNDKEITGLDPEAENYQAIFDLYIKLDQNIERAIAIATDRYNFLLDKAVDDPALFVDADAAPAPNTATDQ